MSIMENTIENKRIFLAQYYGQNALKKRKLMPNGEKLDVEAYKERFGFAWLCGYHFDCFLSLKSTASISDEDVVALTKIIYKEDYVFDYDISHVSWERLTKNLVLQNPNLPNVECYQYLQSKGYALPFRDLSVKELEFYGWIELEQ